MAEQSMVDILVAVEDYGDLVRALIVEEIQKGDVKKARKELDGKFKQIAGMLNVLRENNKGEK